MPTYQVIIHEYNGPASTTGHVNVEFRVDGVTQMWVGNNVDAYYGFFTGGVQDETASSQADIANYPSNHVAHPFTVSQADYAAAYNYAAGEVNEWANANGDYDVIDDNCVTFANQVLIRAVPVGDTFRMDELLTLNSSAKILAEALGEVDYIYHQVFAMYENRFDPFFETLYNYIFQHRKDEIGQHMYWKYTDYSNMMEAIEYDSSVTPMVIDVGGDGIETVSIYDSGVSFDVDGDGNIERTGWISPSDAFLALDRNLNGVVDDGSELFGGKAGDGVMELVALDSNGDGVLDASDSSFGDLVLWFDANSDGISATSEIASLSDCGIESISLQFDMTRRELNNDNMLGETSTVGLAGGAEVNIVDVYFHTYGGDGELPNPLDYPYAQQAA